MSDDWDSNIIQESWENDADEDDVIDDWDAEEENTPITQKSPPPPPVKTTTKPKTKKVVEEGKEPTLSVLDPWANETSIERKARIERIQQEADMDSACSLFKMDKLSLSNNTIIASSPPTAPTTPSSSNISLGGEFYSSSPSNLADFLSLSAHITKRLSSFQSEKSYLPFLENLIISLLGRMDLTEIRLISSSINEIISQKQKEKIALSKTSKKAPPSLKFSKQKDNVYDDLFPSADDDPFA